MPGSSLRAPRLRVLVDGAALPGVEAAWLDHTGAAAADRFRVRAALTDPARWAMATALSVEVQAAMSPDSGFVSLVQGLADAVEIDPQAGALVLEGRDGAAALMETPTQESFANRTGSEIAALIAARHGLAAAVQATATPVGRYWELGHDRITLNAAARGRSEWDLLVELARREGFELFVAAGALHFHAPETAVAAVLDAGAVERLRLERALSFAGDIVVTVKSWHSRIGAGCVGVARSGRGSGAAREHVLVVPNLTQMEADALAARRLGELVAHRTVLLAEMPGELALRPRLRLRLVGAGPGLDAVYRIDALERRIDARGGFAQSLQARAV